MAEKQAPCADNGEPSTTRRRTVAPGSWRDDLRQKRVAYYSQNEFPETAEASSSKQAAGSGKSTSASGKRQCVACMTDFPQSETVRCPCSHGYCRTCLTRLFESTINDESLFPPRCCGKTIPIGPNQKFLPQKLVGEYKAKEQEYTTENKTYCHKANCSTFIPPRFVQGDIATCNKCKRSTCTICKGRTHRGDCPKDEETSKLLRVAADNGWQRCYSCRRVVDLAVGCNHISR